MHRNAQFQRVFSFLVLGAFAFGCTLEIQLDPHASPGAEGRALGGEAVLGAAETPGAGEAAQVGGESTSGGAGDGGNAAPESGVGNTVNTPEAEPTNEAPRVVSAETYRVVLLPEDESWVMIRVTATVSDDGWPNPPGRVTTRWEHISGPRPTGIKNSSVAAMAELFFPEIGRYVLQVTASDGELSSAPHQLVVEVREL